MSYLKYLFASGALSLAAWLADQVIDHGWDATYHRLRYGPTQVDGDTR